MAKLNCIVTMICIQAFDSHSANPFKSDFSSGFARHLNIGISEQIANKIEQLNKKTGLQINAARLSLA